MTTYAITVGLDAEFRAGLHAGRAEFRSTDVHGRPVDPSAETETQRTERIRALQDQRDARGYRDGPPPASVPAVLAEWMTRPENRQSAFARNLADHPGWRPVGRVYRGDLSAGEARAMLADMRAELTAQSG